MNPSRTDKLMRAVALGTLAALVAALPSGEPQIEVSLGVYLAMVGTAFLLGMAISWLLDLI